MNELPIHVSNNLIDVLLYQSGEQTVFKSVGFDKVFHGNYLMNLFFHVSLDSINVEGRNLSHSFCNIATLNEVDPYGRNCFDNYNDIPNVILKNLSVIYEPGKCEDLPKLQDLKDQMDNILRNIPEGNLTLLNFAFKDYRQGIVEVSPSLYYTETIDKTFVDTIDLILDFIINDVSNVLACEYTYDSNEFDFPAVLDPRYSSPQKQIIIHS
jgi:hypothetical protein